MKKLSIGNLGGEQIKSLEKTTVNKDEILNFVGDLNMRVREEMAQANCELAIGNRQRAEACLKYSKILKAIANNLKEVYLNLVAYNLRI